MVEQLDALEALSHAASPAPWFVRHLNDDVCMSAVAIATAPPTDPAADFPEHWPASGIVAACLLQSDGVVIPDDGRYDENARLIVALRNALPELIRLARLGHAQDT